MTRASSTRWFVLAGVHHKPDDFPKPRAGHDVVIRHEESIGRHTHGGPASERAKFDKRRRRLASNDHLGRQFHGPGFRRRVGIILLGTIVPRSLDRPGCDCGLFERRLRLVARSRRPSSKPMIPISPTATNRRARCVIASLFAMHLINYPSTSFRLLNGRVAADRVWYHEIRGCYQEGRDHRGEGDMGKLMPSNPSQRPARRPRLRRHAWAVGACLGRDPRRRH